MADGGNDGGRSITDLPMHDQLLHGIGRVAQAQVQLELVLRQLYVALALPSAAAAHLAPTRRSIDQLGQDCLVMLPNFGLDDDIKIAGESAIKAAIEADKMRHKVVHEWWVQIDPSEASSGSFERRRAAKKGLGYTAERTDIEFINTAEQELRRAYIRIHQLTFAAVNLTFGGVQLPGAPYDPILIPTIRGEFTMSPDGSWQVDGVSGESA